MVGRGEPETLDGSEFEQGAFEEEENQLEVGDCAGVCADGAVCLEEEEARSVCLESAVQSVLNCHQAGSVRM